MGLYESSLMSHAAQSEPAELPTRHTAVVSPGRKISYYKYPTGTTQPEATIVFAHAASFHGRIWDQTIRRLSGNYACISFDFYGHGHSSGSAGDRPASPDSWLDLFDDISSLLDQVEIDGPLVGVGHSLGGAGLFATCLRSADLFDALWVYEPVVFRSLAAITEVGESLAQRAETRRATFDDANHALSWFSDRRPLSDIDPTVLVDYIEHGAIVHPDGIQLSCTPAVEASIYRLGGKLDLFSTANDVKVPALLAVGGLDPLAQKFATDLAQVVASSQVEVFDELSHLGPLERPDLIATSIRQFLTTRV